MQTYKTNKGSLCRLPVRAGWMIRALSIARHAAALDELGAWDSDSYAWSAAYNGGRALP